MSYLGSKAASGAYQAIISLMPCHDTYIETHLGSGAVLKAKPKSLKQIGIEIDRLTIDSYDYKGHAEIVNCDCHKFLVDFDYDSCGRVFIYSDPPYLQSLRGSARYRFDYTDSMHIELLEILKRSPADVMISGYPSKVYDKILESWQTVEFQVMTRGGPRKEKLWMNYELKKPFSSMYAGENFTDRQRIKRKSERWARKYKKLPPSERLSILNALLETHRE